MAAKKSSPKTAPPAKRNPNAFEVVEDGSTTSQALAKLATTSVLSAVTLKRYSGAGDALEAAVNEKHKCPVYLAMIAILRAWKYE